jgi:hypothetical protein
VFKYVLRFSRTFLFHFLIAGAALNQVSYSQVIVQLEVPPPFKFKIEDLWKINLTNPSSALDVYLYATAESIKDDKLLAEATSSAFRLPTGVKKVNAAEISPIDVKKHNDEIEKTLDRFGTLPDGEYRICVNVVSVESNLVVGFDCQKVRVLTLTQPELLSPLNKEVVRDIFPVFNWLPAFAQPSGSIVTYSIIISEILERQTPEYALIANPPWFVETNIRNNLFRYPIGARPMNDGQRYAWRLFTFVDGIELAESEVREFTFENIAINVRERNEDIKEQLDHELKETALKDVNPFYENKVSADRTVYNEIISNELPYGLSEKKFYASADVKVADIGKSLFSSYFTPAFFPDEPEAFEFFTSYSADYQYSNLQGIGSEIPRNYLNLRVDPSMVIYGVPLTFSLFYSSQQQDKFQNINSLAVILDPGYLRKVGEEKAVDRIKELENEVEKMQSELENQKDKLTAEEIEKLNDEIKTASDELESIRKNPEKYLPGQQGFFSMFSTLGIGTTYPTYTNYTMNGARVTGLNLEMNPGWFYFAFAGWNNLDAIPNSSYGRNLFAGRFGAGAKDDSHFHITAVKGQDDQNSLTSNQIPEGLTPQENIVLGTDASLNLFNNVFTMGGEADASAFTRDVNSPDLEDIPEIVKSLTSANISTQVDYAYQLFSTVNIKDSDTKLKGAYKYVGPGYISMGAPGIRRDVAGFDVKLNQILFNRIVNFSVMFVREQNNLISQNISTSTYYKYAFNLRMNFPNAPYLIIDYRPNFVSNNFKADSLKIENNAHVFSLMTGLNVFEDYLTSSTNFIVSVQSSSSNQATDDISVFNFTISENVTFNFPLSLTGMLGFINFSPGDKTTLILDFSSGYLFFNIWNNTMGINYAAESEVSKRTGIYFTSAIPVWEIGNLFVNLQENIYREDVFTYGDRDEFIMRAGFSKRI